MTPRAAVAIRAQSAPEFGAFRSSLNGGDAAILYCFIFFYLFLAGPGPYALDAVRKPGLAAR